MSSTTITSSALLATITRGSLTAYVIEQEARHDLADREAQQAAPS